MSQPTHYSNSICAWPEHDRPREKLVKYGEQHLSNSELLAILLRTGVKGASAVDLSRQILSQFKTFRAMSRADMSEWQAIKGLGPAKIAQIKAALEIGRRFRETEFLAQPRNRIKSSKDAVDILMPAMRDLPVEVFKTIHMNSRNEIISVVEESRGTVNYTTPIIREMLKKALENHAVSIICAHNHPSGDTLPSREDKAFTAKLSQAAASLSLKLLDHIIIGDNRYHSFADEGRLC